MVEREVTTPVVVLEVPGDGVESRRPGRRHRVSCAVGGSGRAPRRAAPWVRLPWVVVSGFEGSLALHPIPGREPADPGLGQAVGACCFGRGQALRGDGGDDQPGSRPHRRFAGPEVLPMSRDMCCSCPEPAHCPRCNCDVSGNTRTYECRSGCCSVRGFAAGSLRGTGGLVVAAGFEGRVAEEFAGGGVDDAGLKVLDEQDDAGSGVGSSHADVVESAAVAQGEASRVLCRPYAGCGSRLRAA